MSKSSAKFEATLPDGRTINQTAREWLKMGLKEGFIEREYTVQTINNRIRNINKSKRSERDKAIARYEMLIKPPRITGENGSAKYTPYQQDRLQTVIINTMIFEKLGVFA